MDDGLVVRARQGDEAAFALLANRIAHRLHGVAYRILRDVALAEDAVQLALLRAWQDLPQLRDPSRFEAWSYRILVRICYAQAKRARKRLAEVPLTDIDPCAPGDDYSTILERAALERAFMCLSMEQRTVVVLHHYLGLPMSEVATTVGAPLETVRSRLRRALDALRAALEADARASNEADNRTQVSA